MPSQSSPIVQLALDTNNRVSVFVVLVALLSLYLTLIKPLFISKLRGFPGPWQAKISGLWLARQCRNTRRSEAVAEQHRKYGDIVRIAPSHLSISHPSALAQIYGHKTGFLKGPFYDAFLQVEPVLFNTRDEKIHHRKRRYMNAAFSPRALNDFEPEMDVEILRWKGRIYDMVTKDGVVAIDMSVWANYLAFDVIGSFAFGASFGFVEAGMDKFNLINTIDARGEVLNALGNLPEWMRSWMKYNYLDSFWSSGLRARANLEKIGRDAYKERKDSETSRKDLLSFLFEAKNPDTGGPLDEDEIVAEAISFIVGGSDTTSSTITNFIDFVSRDIKLLGKIQEELDSAYLETSNDGWVASNKIAGSLPLLNATLREVMRMRPTSATGLERITPAGGRLINGRLIPQGTLVSVPTWNILHDERIYKNPVGFDPYRWLEGDVSPLMEHFHPFSTGPRSCIGRNFAWMEIVKALATLLRTFEIKRKTADLTTVREGFFNKAAECWVELTPRY